METRIVMLNSKISDAALEEIICKMEECKETRFYFSPSVFKEICLKCILKVVALNKSKSYIEVRTDGHYLEMEVSSVINRSFSAYGYSCYRVNEHTINNVDSEELPDFTNDMLFVFETDDLCSEIDLSLLAANKLL